MFMTLKMATPVMKSVANFYEPRSVYSTFFHMSTNNVVHGYCIHRVIIYALIPPMNCSHTVLQYCPLLFLQDLHPVLKDLQ